MIKDTTINEQQDKINQKKVIVAYVLYPCSLYRMCQVKNNSTKIKNKNDETNEQQASLIVKKYVAEFIPRF